MKTTVLIATLVLCASSQAWAVRVANDVKPVPGAARPAAPSDDAAAAAAHADDSSSMRVGAITGVTTAHDQIEVNGSWLKVLPGKTRLFRHGKAVTSEVLVKGQLVKFTLLPGDAERSTLGVIYVP